VLLSIPLFPLKLDSDKPPEQLDSDQDEPDFYEQVPMPV